MAKTTLKNGLQRRVASVPQDGHPGENTVAVVVSGGVLPWVLRFWARIGSLHAYVGAVRTFAMPGDRVVAVVSMPGATAFEVEGQANDPTAVDEIGIHFEGIDSRGGPWGVHAMPGVSVDAARSYRVLTGTAGVMTVTGEVWGWAATASVAAATVAVAAPPGLAFGPVAVPVNGEVNGNARGILAPVSTWTFVNTDSFLIEYLPPGIVFDG
jgi:hypothetical protein